MFSTMSGRKPYYKKSIITLLFAGIVGFFLFIGECVEKWGKTK